MPSTTPSRIFESTADLPKQYHGGVVAIGNFDGVHLGHMGVLRTALEEAGAKSIPAIILTFEPHPRTWFRPEHPVFRLTPFDMKARLLLDMGFDAVVAEPFNKEFAATTATDFIENHLIKNLGAAHVVTGFNFHFGRKRGGTPEFLRSEGERLGFGVSLVEPIKDHGEVVSSSRIRDLLGEGDVKAALALLGRNFIVEGVVVKGAQLGRTLGFPTANIKLPEEAALKHGIYAVRMIRNCGARHYGVASFGRRPTFDNGAPLLETFIFDFSGDLYGEEIAIEFIDWIRGEEKFNSAEALVEQMNIDSEKARSILAVAGKA